MKILLCNKSYPDAAKILNKLVPGVEVFSCAPEDVANHLEGIDVVVPSVAKIDADIISAGTFGLIQQLGVGVDSVDIENATRAGVWVANVPAAGSGNGESVAELAIMQMMMLARNVDLARKNLHEGVFFKPQGMALWNKTACIVGLGDIGKLLAVRLKAFGMRLLAVRNHPEHGAPAECGIEKVFGTNELAEALKEADFVILAIPESKSTHHMFNKERLAQMKAGAFLINVGRGPVVDTNALEEALKDGHIAGAGLDVFEKEPENPKLDLFKQNVVATPHIGGNTDESVKGVIKAIAKNLTLYRQNEEPLNLLNSPSKVRKSLQVK